MPILFISLLMHCTVNSILVITVNSHVFYQWQHILICNWIFSGICVNWVFVCLCVFRFICIDDLKWYIAMFSLWLNWIITIVWGWKKREGERVKREIRVAFNVTHRCSRRDRAIKQLGANFHNLKKRGRGMDTKWIRIRNTVIFTTWKATRQTRPSV
jgi:hypothetical protein